MKIEYEFTRDDFIKFNQYYCFQFNKNRVRVRLLRILIGVLWGLVFIFIILMAIKGDLRFTSDYFIVIFLLLLLSIVAVFLKQIFMLLIKWTVIRQLKTGKNKNLIGSKQLEILPEFIVEETECSKLIINWNGIERIEKNNDYIYIYTSSVSAVIIPNRVFNSNKEYEEYYNLINKYYQSSKSNP